MSILYTIRKTLSKLFASIFFIIFFSKRVNLIFPSELRLASDYITAFHYLYIELKLGQNILPWEKCMRYANLEVLQLPSELNHVIGKHLYGNHLHSQKDATVLLKAFKNKNPTLFFSYLNKIFDIFRLPEHPNFTLDDLIDGIIMIKLFNKKYFTSTSCITRPPCSAVINLLRFRSVVVYELTQTYGVILSFIKSDFLDDEEIMRKAIAWSYGAALSRASKRLKDDRNLVLYAILQSIDFDVLRYASSRLQKDKKLLCLSWHRTRDFALIQLYYDLQT